MGASTFDSTPDVPSVFSDLCGKQTLLSEASGESAAAETRGTLTAGKQEVQMESTGDA